KTSLMTRAPRWPLTCHISHRWPRPAGSTGSIELELEVLRVLLDVDLELGRLLQSVLLAKRPHFFGSQARGFGEGLARFFALAHVDRGRRRGEIDLVVTDLRTLVVRVVDHLELAVAIGLPPTGAALGGHEVDHHVRDGLALIGHGPGHLRH